MIVSALKKNKTLRTLLLAGNDIGDSGMSELRTVMHLSLSFSHANPYEIGTCVSA